MNSQGKSTLFLEGESQPQRDIILIRGNHFITRQYLSSKRPPGLIHMCGKIAVTILFEQTPLFYAKETYHRTLWLKIQPVQSHQESPRLDLHSILKGVPKFGYSPTILQTPVCLIKSLKSTLATGQWQRIMCDTIGVDFSSTQCKSFSQSLHEYSNPIKYESLPCNRTQTNSPRPTSDIIFVI